MAVSQNRLQVPFWGWESHPIIVFFKGFLGVHRGTGVLTHCHINRFVSFSLLVVSFSANPGFAIKVFPSEVSFG